MPHHTMASEPLHPHRMHFPWRQTCPTDKVMPLHSCNLKSEAMILTKLSPSSCFLLSFCPYHLLIFHPSSFSPSSNDQAVHTCGNEACNCLLCFQNPAMFLVLFVLHHPGDLFYVPSVHALFFFLRYAGTSSSHYCSSSSHCCSSSRPGSCPRSSTLLFQFHHLHPS